MKLFTLNTHSLSNASEDDAYLRELADFVIKELPDVIALQEVNQTCSAEEVESERLFNDCKVKCDNYLYRLIKILDGAGIRYNCVWEPYKVGYGRFDEGSAVMSRKEILKFDAFYLSDLKDPLSWQTRKAIGIQNEDGVFYSIHTSRDEKSFAKELSRLNKRVVGNEKVWIMGDFNNDANVRGGGYDAVISSGWYDSHVFAKYKKKEYTVRGEIDGWEDSSKNKRIDFIFSGFPIEIKYCKTVFDGDNEREISDHFGVMIETGSE